MVVAFRRATERDAGALADFWLRARKAAAATMPPPAHPDADVRAWFASHVVPCMECWLAEDAEHTLAGMLVLDGRWLDQLYVEPALTGQGIGSELVELAKRVRPDGLRLWTFASNLGAQRFYERHGFVAVLRTDGRDNEERAPDILYCWPRGRRVTPD
jgi:GNAT superfamily N-acetyltransferase